MSTLPATSVEDAQARGDGDDSVVLEAVDLTRHYANKTPVLRRTESVVKAVDGVSLELHRGETLGVVGETGCGKSTLGRLLVGLEEPTGGTVRILGRDVSSLKGRAKKDMWRDIQLVFQDPYSSLNPRMTVQEIVSEALQVDGWTKRARVERVRELLDLVGLGSHTMHRYPHEFSGGQRQRVGVARALALSPQIIVCDEPVSALDVSIQAQVVNLLQDLQERLGLTLVFISHDLSVVRHIANRVAVMYLGRLMELGPTDALFGAPRHPYTEALLSAVPEADPKLQKDRERILLHGDVPDPANIPVGCRFSSRCQYGLGVDLESDPELVELEPGRVVENCPCTERGATLRSP